MDNFIEEEIKWKKIKPNKHLHNCISIIYYMGLWPERAKYKCAYNLYRACTLVLLLGTVIVSEIAYIIVNWGNLELVIAGATIFMTNSTYIAKVIYIVCRHKRIKVLIDITNSNMFSQDNDKYERIVTQYTWQGIFHHIVYQCLGGTAIIFWGCIPIRSILTGTSKMLPMTGWYPFNVTSTPAYEIACLHQFVVFILSCINNVAIDSLITGLMITTCCQLKLLNRNISSIHYITKDEIVSNAASFKEYTLDAYNNTYANLKICIEHSKSIFHFAKQIQHMFGSLIFFQLLVNCIIVCLIAFNISQMKDYVSIDLFGMLMYMSCMSYQIFIYCWHGNEVYFHSLNICSSAYANSWWYNSKYFKRALLFLMTRAQSPLILTVGNVMELSLQNFVSILRTSYSIFAVLKTSTTT